MGYDWIIKEKHIHIYYFDSGNNIHEIVRPEDVDSKWIHNELKGTAAIKSNISVIDHETETSLSGEDFKFDDMRVYYLTSDWHIHELAYSSKEGQWHPRDVTKDSNAPPAAPGSALASAKYKDGEMRVYYLTSDCWWSGNQHICELASENKPNTGLVWAFKDITKEANALPAAPGSALASVNDSNGEICVYYLTNDQHICELASENKPNTGLVWAFKDITKEANALPAAPGSALASAKCKGEMRVYYLTSDCRLSENQHICELASENKLNTGLVWAFKDITKESNAPPAAPDSALASTNYSDDEIRVYYSVVWNHICELAIKADGSRNSSDITKESNAPPTAPGSMLASAKYNSDGILIYYLTDDQCIVELASKADSGWYSRNVTKHSTSPPAAAGSALKLICYSKSKKEVVVG